MFLAGSPGLLGAHPLAAHLGNGPGEAGERGDEGTADRGPPVDGRAPGKEVGGDAGAGDGAGIPALRTHRCRHTFATRLRQGGADPRSPRPLASAAPRSTGTWPLRASKARPGFNIS